jgi:hypothetical protein
MRRLTRLGVVAEGDTKLDTCLGLNLSQFLERRLQTRVFKAGYAKSIHHARVLIKQRHIRFVLSSGLSLLESACVGGVLAGYWSADECRR